MSKESKNERFKRLAKKRGERVLKDIRLIGNLSDRNNYEYSDREFRHIFGVIEEELRLAKDRFRGNKQRRIDL
jgi:hypothetical protein